MTTAALTGADVGLRDGSATRGDEPDLERQRGIARNAGDDDQDG